MSYNYTDRHAMRLDDYYKRVGIKNFAKLYAEFMRLAHDKDSTYKKLAEAAQDVFDVHSLFLAQDVGYDNSPYDVGEEELTSAKQEYYNMTLVVQWHLKNKFHQTVHKFLFDEAEKTFAVDLFEYEEIAALGDDKNAVIQSISKIAPEWINTSATLAQLCNRLNYLEDIEDFVDTSFNVNHAIDSTSLPIFGNNPPADTDGIYSWDDTREMVHRTIEYFVGWGTTLADRYDIQPRTDITIPEEA